MAYHSAKLHNQVPANKKKNDFDPNTLLKAELTTISYFGIHFSKIAKNEADYRFAYHSAILHNQIYANKKEN